MTSEEKEVGKYDQLCEELEKQEIDAPNGVPPVHIYQKLLAIYLYQNDLPNAKFLWKRIPSSSKASTPELGAIWEVGKNLWQRDFQAVYSSLSREWSPIVKPVMTDLNDSLKQRAVDLVSRAYTSIGLEDFAQLLNISSEDALVKIKGLDWAYDASMNMVMPTKPTARPHSPLTSAKQLKRLTDYVSFLEN